MTLYLLRFGELWLKSEQVKRRFIGSLMKNIKTMLSSSGVREFSFQRERGRIFLTVGKPVDNLLSRVFGMTSFSSVSSGTLETLDSLVLAEGKKLEKEDTFAVRVKRIGKHEFTSKDMEKNLGSLLGETYGNKVDLSSPTKTIYVELRDDECYVFSEYMDGAGGLPIGTEGSVFAEFDGSVAALVAAYLIMRRGCKVTLVGHGDMNPLLAYDPTIGLIERMPDEHHAQAIVSFERPDDAEEVKRHGLYIFRPLAGITEEEILLLHKKING